MATPPVIKPSGAPKGSVNTAKTREIEFRLRKLCEREDWRRVVAGLEIVLDQFAVGDPEAVRYVSEKLDGKPRQPVALTGADDGPVVVADARSLLDGTVDELLERMKAAGDDQ